MGPRARLAALSRLEVVVMNEVWRLGECGSAQVVEAVQARRKLAPTTIRTVLANLREKGYVLPVPSLDRGFRWKPKVSREAVARRGVKELLATLFDGSPRQAIAYLLDEEPLSDADRTAIRTLLAQRNKDGGGA